MRRTIISALIGFAAAGAAVFAIDTYRDIQTASRFAELQQEKPSDWLLIEDFKATGATTPGEPEIKFVGTPAHNLLIRLAISSRESDTGEVLCSGGGATVLYPAGVPVRVDEPISKLAGLTSCDWPAGRYRIRLTFLMSEPQSQVAKTLLIETDDLEVIKAR